MGISRIADSRLLVKKFENEIRLLHFLCHAYRLSKKRLLITVMHGDYGIAFNSRAWLSSRVPRVVLAIGVFGVTR
jgi:hypothetical protein